MKKLLLFILLIPISGFAQKIVDEVKNSSGRMITIYDNKTWEYSDEFRQIPSNIQGFVDTEISETKAQPVTSQPAGTKSNVTIPKKTTTTTSTNTPSRSTTSSYCGARTQKGGSCRRLVKGGGRCYQH